MHNQSPNPTIYTTTLNNSLSIFSGIVETEKSCIEYLRDKSDFQEVKLEDIIPEKDPDKRRATETNADLGKFARENMRTMFYDGLINSRYPSKSVRKKSPYCEIAHFRKNINRKIKCLCNSDIEVNVIDVDFRVMSNELVIFSIKVDNSGMTLDQITWQNLKIRSINYYNKVYDNSKVYTDEWLNLFQDVISLQNYCCKRKHIATTIENISHTLFTGNKLYNYVIAQLPSEIDFEFNDDRLYELANEMKIGTLNSPSDPNYPDEKYKSYLLDTHSIASFSNWKGLAINDTTAIMMKSSVTSWQYDNWQYNYLEFIYFNAFYINAYLMIMNRKYQSREGNADLEKEYLEFDRTFNFHNISYRFQPQLIYERLRAGMEINDELNQLKEKISQYSEKRERENEKTINAILSVLTVITIISVMNDTATIIQLFNDKNVSIIIPIIGVCVGVIILIPCIFYYFIRKIRK